MMQAWADQLDRVRLASALTPAKKQSRERHLLQTEQREAPEYQAPPCFFDVEVGGETPMNLAILAPQV